MNSFDLGEGESGEEGAGQVTRSRVVHYGEVCHDEHPEECEGDVGAVFGTEAWEDFVLDDSRDPRDGGDAEDDEVADCGYNGNEILVQRRILRHQNFQHTQNNQADHIVNHGTRHNQLSHRSIQSLPPGKSIGRHTQTRGRKTRPARNGGFDRLSLCEGKTHPYRKGNDGAGDRDEDGANARLFDETHVQFDARFDQEQNQSQVSQEDHGLRKGDVVGELRAQQEAGDDLSDERRDSDVKGNFSENVGHAEKDEDVVGVFVGNFYG
mmetsp:Transcript_4347/g.9668  ORF Transcript_4347/g.9668 Transcript_4347/m.9668 type:complete len:266 (-) Transcript_4347:816-1613(-)